MVRTPRKILLLAFPLCTVVFVCWQYLGNFPKVSLFLGIHPFIHSQSRAFLSQRQGSVNIIWNTFKFKLGAHLSDQYLGLPFNLSFRHGAPQGIIKDGRNAFPLRHRPSIALPRVQCWPLGCGQGSPPPTCSSPWSPTTLRTRKLCFFKTHSQS